MIRRNRWVVLLVAALILSTAVWFRNWRPEVLEGSVVTRTGVVTDRAMSGGLGYLSAELEDGTAVLCWDLYGIEIPEHIVTGSRVEITWGIEEAHHRNVVLDVRIRE